MSGRGWTLAALLSYGVLTLWVEPVWAWHALQASLLLLAGWRAARGAHCPAGTMLVPLAGAAAWPLLQLALGTSVARWATWNAALDWAAYLAAFFLALDALEDPDCRRAFLHLVSIFGMAVATLAVIQKFTSGGLVFWIFPSGYASDVLGPFVNRNQYAAWIELLLPVSLYLGATERRWRVLHGAAAAVMYGSVIAAASRAGFALATAEVLAVAALLATRNRAARRGIAFAASQFAAVALVAAAIVGWGVLWDRLESRAPEELRLDAAHASLAMIIDKPLFGQGLGTWSTVYPRYARLDTGVFVNQAHDDWAQWAAEGGLPFFLCLACFAAVLWKPAMRSIYGVGAVAFLLHGLVDYPMQQRPALAVWFFVMAGLIATRRPGQRRRVHL